MLFRRKPSCFILNYMLHIPVFAIFLCFIGCGEDKLTPPGNEVQRTVSRITDLVAVEDTIYAAAYYDGVFRIEDEKDTWQRLEGLFFI